MIPFGISATSSNSSGTTSCLRTNSLVSSSFKALALSFSCFSCSALHFHRSPSLSLRSRLAENFSDCLAHLLCPKIQTRNPVWVKSIPKISCFSTDKVLATYPVILQNIPVQIVSDYCCQPKPSRSIDNCSISSPWFVMTFGTWQSNRSPEQLLLFPNPAIKQNNGMIPISGFENRLSSSVRLFWCYMCYFKL